MPIPSERGVRRLVTVDATEGRSRLWSDARIAGAAVLRDPARPGFSSTLVWRTDASPARPVVAQPAPAQWLQPPPEGSLYRIDVLPPDDGWRAGITPAQVTAWFAAAGAPGAACPGAGAHPYRLRTRSLDLCVVLAGRVTLLLDTREVHLVAGDTVVQRGTRHAYSNRHAEPAVIAISAHGARSPAALATAA